MYVCVFMCVCACVYSPNVVMASKAEADGYVVAFRDYFKVYACMYVRVCVYAYMCMCACVHVCRLTAMW